MSDTSPIATDASDADLLVQVRAGRLDAYGELFARHREAADRLARHLVRGPDADDLVAEGFSRVLTALQNGKGPDEFFRAYLLTSMRRLHVDRIRAAQRVRTTDDEAELDRAVAFVDPAEMKFEQNTAAAAFASLPERWQLVLWHLDVEGQKPAEVAPLLGMSPNSVSALAYRAREGLRTAYLQGHLAPALDDACRRTTPLLGQHVRDNLSRRDATRVDEHLDTCPRCSGLYAELSEVNNHLAGLLLPAVLGTAAAGYLASSGSTATVGMLTQLADGLSRPFRWASTTTGAAPGAVVATSAALVLAVAAGVVAVSQVIDREDSAIVSAASDAASPPSASPATPDPADTSPHVDAQTAEAVPTLPSPISTQIPRPRIVPSPQRSEHDAQRTPAARPHIAPGPAPSPPAGATPAPSPTPSPSGPTHTVYTTTAAMADESPAYQRRLTVSIAATGDEPTGNTLSVALTFSGSAGAVHFRNSPSSDWRCDVLATNQEISSLTCTRDQTGAAVPDLSLSIFGCNPSITAALSVSNNTGTAPGSISKDAPPYQGATGGVSCQDPTIR